MRGLFPGVGVATLCGATILWVPGTAAAMHIMEGFLPQMDALIWLCALAPFYAYGLWKINKLIRRYPERKLLLGVATALSLIHI